MFSLVAFTTPCSIIYIPVIGRFEMRDVLCEVTMHSIIPRFLSLEP